MARRDCAGRFAGVVRCEIPPAVFSRAGPRVRVGIAADDRQLPHGAADRTAAGSRIHDAARQTPRTKARVSAVWHVPAATGAAGPASDSRSLTGFHLRRAPRRTDRLAGG